MPDDTTSVWDEVNVESVCRLWDLSSDEKASFLELKDRVDDVDYPLRNNPSHLVRFLKARPGNLDAAEEMFRKMVEWRLKNRADQILEEFKPSDELMKYYPGAVLIGVDREEDPIFVSRMGATDAAGMLNKYGQEYMVKHAIWLRECVTTGKWIQDYEKKYNKPVKRVTIIEDLHGLGMAHANRQLISLYGEIMRLDQDNYPESAKKLIIIRTPAVFRMVWSIVKHFFDPGVVAKMTFCGPSDYSCVLEKLIDLEVLPKEIVPQGKGSAVAGMPSCFEGGKLPK